MSVCWERASKICAINAEATRKFRWETEFEFTANHSWCAKKLERIYRFETCGLIFLNILHKELSMPYAENAISSFVVKVISTTSKSYFRRGVFNRPSAIGTSAMIFNRCVAKRSINYSTPKSLIYTNMYNYYKYMIFTCQNETRFVFFFYIHKFAQLS